MGQALATLLNKQDKIAAAYRNPLRTIASIIPYLEQRHEVAKKLIETYAGNQEAENHLYEIMEQLNKDISVLLGIEIEKH